jgi:hypothetical protein
MAPLLRPLLLALLAALGLAAATPVQRRLIRIVPQPSFAALIQLRAATSARDLPFVVEEGSYILPDHFNLSSRPPPGYRTDLRLTEAPDIERDLKRRLAKIEPSHPRIVKLSDEFDPIKPALPTLEPSAPSPEEMQEPRPVILKDIIKSNYLENLN